MIAQTILDQKNRAREAALRNPTVSRVGNNSLIRQVGRISDTMQQVRS